MSGQLDYLQESSSSSRSSYIQESEDDLTIGSILAEANYNSSKNLGKCSSHLDSIPVCYSVCLICSQIQQCLNTIFLLHLSLNTEDCFPWITVGHIPFPGITFDSFSGFQCEVAKSLYCLLLVCFLYHICRCSNFKPERSFLYWYLWFFYCKKFQIQVP